MNFREFDDARLAKLTDEPLIAYTKDARRAGKIEAAVTAAQILAYRYERNIRGFVFRQMGSKGDLACEDVAERTLVDAIRSAASFEGATIAEFRSWLFTIARRRVYDYMRKNRVSEEYFGITHKDGETEEREFTAGDPFEAIDDASVFKQAFSRLSMSHKLVIILIRFHDLPHKEVAEQVNRHFGDELDDPMTEDNVNQINSRFKKELERLLDEADDPPPLADDDD